MYSTFSCFRLLAKKIVLDTIERMSSVVSRTVELRKVIDHDQLSISRYRTTLANVHCACTVPFLVSRCWQKTYDCVRYKRMRSVVSRIVELGKVLDHDRLSISRYRTTLANVHCACTVPFLVSGCWQKTYDCVRYNRMSSVVSRIVELGKVLDHDRLSIFRYEPHWQPFIVHAQCLFLFQVVGKRHNYEKCVLFPAVGKKDCVRYNRTNELCC